MTRVAIEACCYAALAWAFLSMRDVRAYAAALSAPHRWVLGACCVILTVGQLVDRPRLTFPFTSWAMYGKPESPETLVFYRYRGLDADQRPVTVPAESLLSVVGASGVASKTRALARAGLTSTSSEKQRVRLAEWLGGIGGVYNRRHPERPIHALELVRCSLPLRSPGAARVTEEPVLRVALEHPEPQ